MTKKVMIVDDDVEFLHELSELMESNGYEVTVCEDGESALNMLNRIKPDIILLDLKMDKVNGFQVAARIRRIKDASEIPIVAMTGYYTQEEYALMMKMCGVRKFIIKPIDPETILKDTEYILSAK